MQFHRGDEMTRLSHFVSTQHRLPTPAEYCELTNQAPVQLTLPLEEPKAEAEAQETGGTKFDGGKCPLDLLDTRWEEAVAEVLAFGAKKYEAYNWRKGFPYSRLFAAVRRHLNQFWRNEDLDSESGLHHLAHASCGLMFLYVMATERPDLDDRCKGAK